MYCIILIPLSGKKGQKVLNGKFHYKDLLYPFPARQCSVRQFVTKEPFFLCLLPFPFLSVWRVLGPVTLSEIAVHHNQLKLKHLSVALFFPSQLYYLLSYSLTHKKVINWLTVIWCSVVRNKWLTSYFPSVSMESKAPSIPHPGLSSVPGPVLGSDSAKHQDDKRFIDHRLLHCCTPPVNIIVMCELWWPAASETYLPGSMARRTISQPCSLVHSHWSRGS